MALPDPFNTVEELALWSGFQQGPSNGQDSVLEGTFAYGQFQTALRQARREIYRKTGLKQNAEFSEDRQDELKEAELWLAVARLYPNFASRMQLEFPESNIQSTGEVMNGADTPSPYEKVKQLMELMYENLRRIGLDLLESSSTRFYVSLGREPQSERFPCLVSSSHSFPVQGTLGCATCGGCL